MEVTTRKDDFVDSYPENKPFIEVIVGAVPDFAEESHEIRVYNKNNSDSVPVFFEIMNGDTTILSCEGEIKSKNYLAVVLGNRENYTVRLSTSEDDTYENSIEIEEDDWDVRGEHHAYIRGGDIDTKFLVLT